VKGQLISHFDGMGASSSSEFKFPIGRRVSVDGRLSGLRIEELKAQLGRNNQIKSGTKVDLIKRIWDGLRYGAFPKCPECKLGLIRRIGKTYQCMYATDLDSVWMMSGNMTMHV
jgi:hypothetical protein